MLRQLAVLVTLFLSFSVQSCISFKPPKFEPLDEDPTPKYFPLNVPQSEIPLPAVIVGEQEQLSGGCLTSTVERKSTAGFNELIQEALKEKNFEAGLKAEFEKAIVKAGLDVSVSQALMQSWRTEIKGVKIDQVDPANAVPNFTNESCRVAELRWFEDERTVVTGGLLADTLSVKMEHALSSEQIAKLQAAINSINVNLGLSFKNASESQGEVLLNATNVYFGAFTTELSMTRCKEKLNIELEPGQSITTNICEDNYIVVVERSAGSERFTVNVTMPEEGIETGQLDIEPNRTYAHALGQNRLVSIFINHPNPNQNEVEIRTTILLVGISGKELTDK
ncbi:MAG: hypothetical protein ACE5IW_13050 [bacterium]